MTRAKTSRANARRKSPARVPGPGEGRGPGTSRLPWVRFVVLLACGAALGWLGFQARSAWFSPSPAAAEPDRTATASPDGKVTVESASAKAIPPLI